MRFDVEVFEEVENMTNTPVVGTDEELRGHLQKYFEMKAELQKLQDLEKKMREKINNIMKALDVPRFEDENLGAVYYETRKIERIDAKRLKKELPDLYKTYVITKETTYLKIISAQELRRRKEFAKKFKK